MSGTADGIISKILEEDDVIERIYDIKERSSDIYEHSISLCSLATLTALKLNLSKERVHDIAIGSLLHDLGLRYMTISYQNQNIDSLSPVSYTHLDVYKRQKLDSNFKRKSKVCLWI